LSPHSGEDSLPDVAGLPMLLECDRQGRVIWLSERTRSTVGEPETLAEALEAGRSSPQGVVRLFTVLSAHDGMVLAVEVGASEASAQRGLRHLEARLLGHYFRLHKIERRLAARVARKKRAGGRSAVRQIELERQRLGRELHTGIGQMLAAIRLQLEFVTAQLSDPPATVRQALQNIAALAAGALDQMRSISRRLHPPEWQRLTIDAALRQLWEVSGIPLRFRGRLDLQTPDREPDPEIKSLLYRTAQEGLSNIIGHAQAETVTMSLEQAGDRLLLVLEDDGVGFDAVAHARAPVHVAAGIGLRSMEEQAAALDAKIQIASGPNGTKLILSTPFTAES